jgi:hypothetical protein
VILPNTAWGRCALNPAKQPGTSGSRAAALGLELVPSARDDPKSQRITLHEKLCMTTVLDEPRRPTQASGPAVGHHRVDETLTQQQVDLFADATLEVESMFTMSYEIDGEPRPACVDDVIVMYP